MALIMKEECEICRIPLPHKAEAYICSYECTFCPSCTENRAGICPNCGGELCVRPKREADG